MKKLVPVYEANKDKLALHITEGGTMVEMAKKFNIGLTTAYRWVDKYFAEEGHLTEEKAAKIKNEYITKTRNDFETSRNALIKMIYNSEINPNTRINAINSIINLRKSEADILSRFGVLPEKPEVQVNIDSRNLSPIWELKRLQDEHDKKKKEKEKED